MFYILAMFASFFSVNTLANDYSGVRIGLGKSYLYADTYSPITGFVNEELKGSAFKVELGYDFNRVIGIGASYAISTDFWEGSDLNASAAKVYTELGYAFSSNGAEAESDSAAGWETTSAMLKPYLKIGAVNYEMKSKFTGSSKTFSDSSLFVGVGGRLELGHLYFDFTADYFNQALPQYYIDNKDADVDAWQLGVVAGIKF